ncbi:hypothetical protein PLEOSDRAFT_158188 [Pleurotus ostreatus PC15]|uniref:Uncharacterized protein n=1 Tax=Pleurotus ostreatus (strain PC15) TaxID=1137138 RepID=A0A067NUY5_PLEO1|nr:hypothetical protein PLEOSDRAFT_158188 [Pleurotus ostreatus PC15]
MQFFTLAAFALACMTMTVSAAPVPAAVELAARAPEAQPGVEVAREPQPEPWCRYGCI